MLSFFKTALCRITLVAVVPLSVATPGLAQSRTADFKGNIPFQFVAGNRTLPAGKYTITALGETTFQIQGADKTSVLVQTHSTERKNAANVTTMIFQRRGDAYVLSELWTAGNRIGRQLFMATGEAESSVQEPEIAVVHPAN